jgi:hypothetical protein
VTELDSVRAWLHRSGYPLEFRAAAAFRDAGFTVFQGIHYPSDSPEATGARDVDVLAVREELVPKHPMTRCTVVFVIECKTSTVPCVLFRSRADGGRLEATEALRMNAVSELDVFGALEWGQDPWALRVPANAAFRIAALAGKASDGVGDTGEPEPARGRRSQLDHAFNAVRQAVSAADGVLRENPQHLPTIAIPVVVVSSRLYAVSFGSGMEEIIEVPWERILWRGDRTAAPRTIDVVSENGLSAYVREASAGAAEMLPILRGAALGRREDEMHRERLDVGLVERLLIRAVGGTSAVRRWATVAGTKITSRFR